MNFIWQVETLTLCWALLLHLTSGSAVKPAIRKEPQDIIVKSSSFIVLCIKSPGSSVEWYRNGKRLDTALDSDFHLTNDGSLHVTNAQIGRDEGSYHCLVSNGKRSIISRTAEVRFAYLKPFDVGDWVEEKNENDHAVLNCTPPDSFPQPEIQWEKRTDSGRQLITQSAHYVVSQEGDLHFAFVDKTDSAQYQCIVTNKLLTDSNVVRRTVSLNVLPEEMALDKPPKVADEFALPKIALKGEKFHLECIVYGKPIPRITLRKKGLHTLLGRTTGNVNRLEIKSFNQDDAGKYKCRATDHLGQSDTKTTVVTMEEKPGWIMKPKDSTAGANTTVTLPCVAFGIPLVQYTWYFNGTPMVSSERHNFSAGNLTIKKLLQADMGIYQCFVRNKHGQMHADLQLTVSEIPAGFGPGSRAPESNQKALIHSTVKLSCSPTGEPKPTVRWLFGGMQLSNSGEYRILPNGNLIINNVTKKDSGEYMCEASNRLSKANRKGFLQVQEYVEVTENMQEVSVVLGRNIRFMCGVTTLSGIEVTVQWDKFFSPVPIVSNRHIRVWRKDTKNELLSTSEMRGYLEINGAQYSDGGLYRCQAVGNNKELFSKEAFLNVLGPPDPPTNVNFHHAINRGESINVTWVLGQENNSPIRKVIIQCTTQFYPDTWETIAEEYDPQKGWTQISLSPWLRYNFRVIATNDIGNSTPSAQTTSFQAPPAAPSHYPREIRGHGTSHSTLRITWQPLQPIDHNGPGLYYVVYYKRADGSGKCFRQEVKNESSFLVLGTDYYVKYTIKLQAANNIGFGPISPAVFAYSGEKIPVGAPRDLSVRITSATSAYATWTGVAETREAMRGKLLGYKVYFWKAPSGQTPYKAEVKATIDTSTTLHLQAYTSYRFQVVAYNNIGDGPASNVVGPLTTPESKIVGTNATGSCTDPRGQSSSCPGDFPDPPRRLSLNVQNHSYILLQWSPPEQVNGAITDYQVTVQTLPAPQITLTWQTNDSSTEMKLPHLDPTAMYKISVLAINRMGKGPPVVARFDLNAAPQVPPHDVKAFFVDVDKKAILSWNYTSLTDIEGFRIFYWRRGRKLQTVDVEKTRRRKEISLGFDNDNMNHFEISAFKIIRGGHYILGPRSKPVKAGKVRAIRAPSTGSSGEPCTLLISAIPLILMALHWLQTR